MDHIREIIKKSGNSFHSKVANHLKSNGWHVLISPYYTDGLSDKPREIDLIAEKAIHITNFFGQPTSETINLKLYIECKYIPNSMVFWFSEIDTDKAHNLLLRKHGFTDRNTFIYEHRYVRGGQSAAKLFAYGPNNKTNNNSSKSSDNDPFYKALNQSISGMVYSRQSGSILPKKSNSNIIPYVIEYPIILCNSFDNFYRVEMHDESNPTKINEDFMLEVNYAYVDVNHRSLNEYFLLDVVSYSNIEKYLSVIDDDAERLKNIKARDHSLR